MVIPCLITVFADDVVSLSVYIYWLWFCEMKIYPASAPGSEVLFFLMSTFFHLLAFVVQVLHLLVCLRTDLLFKWISSRFSVTDCCMLKYNVKTLCHTRVIGMFEQNHGVHVWARINVDPKILAFHNHASGEVTLGCTMQTIS